MSTLPDVCKTPQKEPSFQIDRVGMGGMEIPICYLVRKKRVFSPSKVNCFVNLVDPTARGIHMSRLYEITKKRLESPLTSVSLRKLMEETAGSQGEDLSDSSYVQIAFDLMVEQDSLTGGDEKEGGWRYYPISLEARWERGKLRYFSEVSILYSSTCPCSLALSRELMKEKFTLGNKRQDMVSVDAVKKWLSSEESIVATPHAQRSLGKIKVEWKEIPFDLIKGSKDLICEAERTLKTSVQSFVKREDEQEFARLNAENPMFCEDASRRIKKLLESKKEVADYFIHVNHMESLHPHNAESFLVKGVRGGFRL